MFYPFYPFYPSYTFNPPKPIIPPRTNPYQPYQPQDYRQYTVYGMLRTRPGHFMSPNSSDTRHYAPFHPQDSHWEKDLQESKLEKMFDTIGHFIDTMVNTFFDKSKTLVKAAGELFDKLTGFIDNSGKTPEPHNGDCSYSPAASVNTMTEELSKNQRKTSHPQDRKMSASSIKIVKQKESFKTKAALVVGIVFFTPILILSAIQQAGKFIFIESLPSKANLAITILSGAMLALSLFACVYYNRKCNTKLSDPSVEAFDGIARVSPTKREDVPYKL